MTRYLFPVVCALTIVGCSRAPSPAPAADKRAAAPPHSARSANETLEALDTRAGVPLLPMMAHHQKQNMRDHLAVVQEIVRALASDDFAGVAHAAERIGFSERMGSMCTHMGAAAPGFTEQALRFHHAADGITSAAHARDRNAVISALGVTLQSCTSCHAAWKQQVVDEATWTQLTAPPKAKAQ